MSKLMEGIEISEIQKGTYRIGLDLSESELRKLISGKIVSLEDRTLSEIGLVFILTEALIGVNSMNSVKSITFRELPKVSTDFSTSSGVSVYSWNSHVFGKCCLLLTLVDGKPAIQVSCQRVLLTS
jgi:hypothetical protein